MAHSHQIIEQSWPKTNKDLKQETFEFNWNIVAFNGFVYGEIIHSAGLDRVADRAILAKIGSTDGR